MSDEIASEYRIRDEGQGFYSVLRIRKMGGWEDRIVILRSKDQAEAAVAKLEKERL